MHRSIARPAHAIAITVALLAPVPAVWAQTAPLWRWQNPQSTYNRLNAASFTRADTGTAVGNYGTVIRTIDGGASWDIQRSGTSLHLLGVSLAGASIGTAVGYAGTILRTTDGGGTWVAQNSGTGRMLHGVSFPGANAGTVVGASGTILRTTNGGSSWAAQNSGTASNLYGVSFTDAQTGTVVGVGGTILRTTDGGATWIAQNSGTASTLYGVSFSDAAAGVAVGAGNTVLRTINAGVDWNRLPTDFLEDPAGEWTNFVFRDVAFTDSVTGVVVGTFDFTHHGSTSIQGLILSTTDGGVSWGFNSSYPALRRVDVRSRRRRRRWRTRHHLSHQRWVGFCRHAIRPYGQRPERRLFCRCIKGHGGGRGWHDPADG